MAKRASPLIEVQDATGRPVANDETPDGACCTSALTAPLGTDDAATLARGFAALADPARLRLLSLLATAEAGEVCACDLTAPIGKSQPTVSHHLKVLAEAGLVTGEKRGRWVWYRTVPEQIEGLRRALDPMPG